MGHAIEENLRIATGELKDEGGRIGDVLAFPRDIPAAFSRLYIKRHQRSDASPFFILFRREDQQISKQDRRTPRAVATDVLAEIAFPEIFARMVESNDREVLGRRPDRIDPVRIHGAGWRGKAVEGMFLVGFEGVFARPFDISISGIDSKDGAGGRVGIVSSGEKDRFSPEDR